MEFEAALRTLVVRAAGLRACALLDQDGIVVASAAADPADSQEDLGAHCALFLRELATIVPRLEGGPLRATILDAERGSVVLILLQGKYGLALHLDRDGNLGQALFEARKVGFALNAALA